MKKTILIVLLALFSCKSDQSGEKPIAQPERVLKKWATAIKNLDYERYAECEVHPRLKEEFLNMYKDYYLSEIQINTETRETKIDRDQYHKRELLFDCVMVNRKSHNAKKRIVGNVDFIKYIDLTKSKRGWLMFNRTLIETNL